jgi:hypothetical protein
MLTVSTVPANVIMEMNSKEKNKDTFFIGCRELCCAIIITILLLKYTNNYATLLAWHSAIAKKMLYYTDTVSVID